MKLLVHAPNIHTGGGRVLLELLISAAQHQGNTQFILDERFVIPHGTDESLVIKRVAPSLKNRLGAELTLPAIARFFDRVLCFGNLPPVMKLPVETWLFIQNRYLLENATLDGFDYRAKLRLSLERVWLRNRIGNVAQIVVQTESMKVLVKNALSRESLTIPFWRNAIRQGVSNSTLPETCRNKRFLYPASGEPHKNHLNLVQAWKCLAKNGLFPTLALTLDTTRDARLLATIRLIATKSNLVIENVSDNSERQIGILMHSADAMIFPSLLESLGLPLLESIESGKPVLASESDVVRDILDPEQTFDPLSPDSIARAVMRFLGVNSGRTEIRDPAAFLDQVRA